VLALWVCGHGTQAMHSEASAWEMRRWAEARQKLHLGEGSSGMERWKRLEDVTRGEKGETHPYQQMKSISEYSILFL
jgi:hypothetical protein